MQVGDPGGAVDIMRLASRCRNPTVDGLTNLTDDHKIIDMSHTERAENIFPRPGQRSDPSAE